MDTSMNAQTGARRWQHQLTQPWCRIAATNGHATDTLAASEATRGRNSQGFRNAPLAVGTFKSGLCLALHPGPRQRSMIAAYAEP
jgi:hypothetical protein